MPEFQQAQLEAYLSKALDAVIRGDKAALRRFGQQDGFINNRIRRFVWYVDSAIHVHSRPCLLDCSDCEYALYKDVPQEFPDLDERDKITLQQDVRRSFTRFPGTSITSLSNGRPRRNKTSRIRGEIGTYNQRSTADSPETALCPSTPQNCLY